MQPSTVWLTWRALGGDGEVERGAVVGVVNGMTPAVMKPFAGLIKRSLQRVFDISAA